MRKIFLLIILLISSFMLSACSTNADDLITPTPSGSDVNNVTQDTPTIEITFEPTNIMISNKLIALLPAEEGYSWIYNGFAEYGHQMTLDTIKPDDIAGSLVYEISGKVDDASGGESNKDYWMSITYIITDDTIVQECSGEMLMDRKFEQIEIIKLPLTEDSIWEQIVIDKDGSSIILECKIEDVTEQDSVKSYSVSYKDKNSDYFEERKIEEGRGVVFYEKLYIPDEGEAFEMGYYLYE